MLANICDGVIFFNSWGLQKGSKTLNERTLVTIFKALEVKALNFSNYPSLEIVVSSN